MNAPLDPLSQALADAVELHRQSRADSAVLTALRAAVDDCCDQLRTLQDGAVADADRAIQRLLAAQAGGDPAATAEAYIASAQAVERAQQVSQRVVTALEDLLAGSLNLTGPAMARLQRGLDATLVLIAEAEQAAHRAGAD